MAKRKREEIAVRRTRGCGYLEKRGHCCESVDDGQIGVDYLLGEIAVLPYARVTTANNESVHVDDSTARAELPPAWAVTQPVASMAAPGTRVGEGAAGPPREGSLRYRGSSHNEVTVEGGGGSEGIAGSKSPPIIAAIKRPGKT
ncbi:hypothetical protein PC129_g15077 [Phytophthora cactorum]|uniref:Uncharacterized protein n=1 Tax=Phytophthora cactorum TaxID=29920 RepID=A0A8T1FFD0_9STRA|nr:hypothetical protein PC112_g16982 [Phytophthora cactorum]KAG2809921.1 hypothetical protein PC111_g15859 [Phytophthora cactorum]KAG2850136.1 hypothetical protein PC113_g17044 [Phytophthora cactorum]KAG2887798.1 hypothetical protein PC114_g18668 [Phytophthora cactorum]KAG2899802.1 hypothetical protein PC115_g16428 [Phytophthora cactorum]